jgi:hypothetical protein
MFKIPLESKLLVCFITCALTTGTYVGFNKLRNDPLLKSNKFDVNTDGRKGVVYPFSKLNNHHYKKN